MTGGAVKAACEAVRARVLELAAERLGRSAADLALRDGAVVADGEPRLALGDLLADGAVEETREYHHRQTQALDPETGQADAHMAFAFAAHRAVVDVDTELGLVKVVEIATAQDVGKAINPRPSRARSRAASPRASASPSWRRSRSPTARSATLRSPTI
jgi:CO/xanthine dehydrogenase Mo-binding subunit